MGFLPRQQFEGIARAIATSIPPAGSNTAAGVIQAEVRAIRSFLDSSGDMAVAVLDDARPEENGIPENPAHAIVLQVKEYSDEEIVEIKTELMDQVFSDLITLDDLRHNDD